MQAIEHSCFLFIKHFSLYEDLVVVQFLFLFIYECLVFVVQDSVEGVVAVATYFPFSRLIVNVPALAMYQLLTFIRV